MKYVRTTILGLLIFSMSTLTTGCFGSFQLTRNFYQWHDSTFDNKFVKSLLFWIPFSFVYGITAFADVVVFNLIEFWSGSNPLSMNEGESETEFKGYENVPIIVVFYYEIFGQLPLDLKSWLQISFATKIDVP